MTPTDGKVDVHPGSVNAREHAYRTRWLVYGTKLRSSATYLRDTSAVCGLALLLLGGPVARAGPSVLSMLGGWARLTLPGPEGAELLLRLRARLDVLLERRLDAPGPESAQEGMLIDTTVLLLTGQLRQQQQQQQGARPGGNVRDAWDD
jgi:ATP-dependent RNA helicase DHX36